MRSFNPLGARVAVENFPIAVNMIITCPNCQTRYQVAEKAIGSAGRKVQCAHCNQSWQAVPEKEEPKPKPKLVEQPSPPKPDAEEDDRLFDEADEAALDEAFAREEEKVAPAKPKTSDAGERDKPDKPEKADEAEVEEGDDAGLDAALKKSRRKAMLNRQMSFAKNLPMGRIRSNARFAGLCLLALVIGGGLFFRTEVVRLIPDLAGVYSAIGMGVNVVGLEFRDVETLRALKNGADVMVVSARIQNVTGRQVKVPAVLVSILDEAGVSLYSWSVTPLVQVIGPGEIMEFETQLNSAPQDAYTVKLAFADGRAR